VKPPAHKENWNVKLTFIQSKNHMPQAKQKTKNMFFLHFNSNKNPESLKKMTISKKSASTEIFGRKRWHVRESGRECWPLITI
jgi:hypothetical protein